MINYALSFVAVVKAGSFSLAAKNIGVSKAQLSRHVSRLEELLGVKLLYRTTRTSVLTEQGKQFYASCQGIEAQYNEAVNSLTHDFTAMQGTVRMTAPIDFGIEFLPPIIHQFTKKYTNMNVVLSLSNRNEDLLEQNYDFAIRIANKLPDSNLRMRIIMKFKRLICASPDYFKNKKRPKHPAELKDHRCITSLNRGMDTLKPQWQFCEKKKLVNYSLNNVIEVDSLLAQLALIQCGSGIGRMPNYFICNELKTGKLVELFANIEKPTSYVYLLYPDLKVLPKKTQIFIEFLKKAMELI
ncbi:MAG: LysR family transcriptional regulator [uncultured bacterium]|nr:MAG: LysR family transcriptional regulator [uncultured bacterium]